MTTYNFSGANGDPLPPGLTARNGTFEINSNRLVPTGSDPLGPKWVCTGESQADGDFSCIVNCGGSNSGAHGVVFRYSNNDNFWMLVIGGSGGGDLQLFKRSSGVFTAVDIYAIPSFSNSTDYTLLVTTTGNSIRAFLNGVERISTTDSHNSNSTESGLRFGGLAGEVDQLEYPTPATTESISIDSDPTQRLWQRTSSDNASVTISGTYTGSPTSIERQINSGAWVTAVASPSGNVFSDTFTLNTGENTVSYRFSNDTGVIDTLTPVVVGEGFACAGQSNMVGSATNNQAFNNSAGGVTAYLFGNDDQFKTLSDPYDSDTNQVDSVSADPTAAGSWIVRFANQWLANNEVPIFFIPCAHSGTAISEWARDTSASTLYGSMKRRIDAVGGVSRVLWEQGERDSRDVVNTPGATYQAALEQLATDINSDFGVDTFVIPLHTITASGYTNQATIRQAQLDAAAASSLIDIGQPLTDIDLSGGDGLHFQTNAELNTVATRMYSSYTSVNVEGGTPNLSYSSVDGVVDLTSGVSVVGSTPNFNYQAINGSVRFGSFSPVVNFSGTIKQSSFSGVRK